MLSIMPYLYSVAFISRAQLSMISFAVFIFTRLHVVGWSAALDTVLR